MENEKEIETVRDDRPDVEARPTGSPAPAHAAAPPVSVVLHSEEGASEWNVMDRQVCHKPRRCGGMRRMRGDRPQSIPLHELHAWLSRAPCFLCVRARRH
ncbi:hypothetical protein CS8_066510 [Cupriavidus sp. 8B]